MQMLFETTCLYILQLRSPPIITRLFITLRTFLEVFATYSSTSDSVGQYTHSVVLSMSQSWRSLSARQI